MGAKDATIGYVLSIPISTVNTWSPPFRFRRRLPIRGNKQLFYNLPANISPNKPPGVFLMSKKVSVKRFRFCRNRNFLQLKTCQDRSISSLNSGSFNQATALRKPYDITALHSFPATKVQFKFNLIQVQSTLTFFRSWEIISSAVEEWKGKTHVPLGTIARVYVHVLSLRILHAVRAKTEMFGRIKVYIAPLLK